MTTTIDPGGSPSVIYNRDGVTIVDVAANGTTAMSATEIVRYSGYTVARVTSTPNVDVAVKLPADAEIGDVVEFHSATTISVFPPSGESILGYSYREISIPGSFFRKIDESLWGQI